MDSECLRTWHLTGHGLLWVWQVRFRIDIQNRLIQGSLIEGFDIVFWTKWKILICEIGDRNLWAVKKGSMRFCGQDDSLFGLMG